MRRRGRGDAHVRARARRFLVHAPSSGSRKSTAAVAVRLPLQSTRVALLALVCARERAVARNKNIWTCARDTTRLAPLVFSSSAQARAHAQKSRCNVKSPVLDRRQKKRLDCRVNSCETKKVGDKILQAFQLALNIGSGS